MGYLRPESVPVEGAGKLAVVAAFAVTGTEGSKLKGGFVAREPAFDVFASGAVAGFAADVGQFGVCKGAAVSGGFTKAHGVAADAGGVGL